MLKQKAGTLPNLIVIGTQKGETSSLHYYLSLHPQICMSREKELNFFISERDWSNWKRGVEWYKKKFIGKAQIYGESSPNYTNYPRYDQVPKRMHSIVPEAKLVYILRDPIKRIISHYMHKYSKGKENRSLLLDESLESEIINFLKLDINRLRECTGIAFENWCL